jgi:alkylated DNA nucleotide flippase Atl1
MPEGDVASVLDAADLIVTAAGPEIVAEIESERQARPWWKVWKKKEGGGFDLSAR